MMPESSSLQSSSRSCIHPVLQALQIFFSLKWSSGYSCRISSLLPSANCRLKPTNNLSEPQARRHITSDPTAPDRTTPPKTNEQSEQTKGLKQPSGEYVFTRRGRRCY